MLKIQGTEFNYVRPINNEQGDSANIAQKNDQKPISVTDSNIYQQSGTIHRCTQSSSNRFAENKAKLKLKEIFFPVLVQLKQKHELDNIQHIVHEKKPDIQNELNQTLAPILEKKQSEINQENKKKIEKLKKDIRIKTTFRQRKYIDKRDDKHRDLSEILCNAIINIKTYFLVKQVTWIIDYLSSCQTQFIITNKQYDNIVQLIVDYITSGNALDIFLKSKNLEEAVSKMLDNELKQSKETIPLDKLDTLWAIVSVTSKITKNTEEGKNTHLQKENINKLITYTQERIDNCHELQDYVTITETVCNARNNLDVEDKGQLLDICNVLSTHISNFVSHASSIDDLRQIVKGYNLLIPQDIGNIIQDSAQDLETMIDKAETLYNHEAIDQNEFLSFVKDAYETISHHAKQSHFYSNLQSKIKTIIQSEYEKNTSFEELDTILLQAYVQETNNQEAAEVLLNRLQSQDDLIYREDFTSFVKCLQILNENNVDILPQYSRQLEFLYQKLSNQKLSNQNAIDDNIRNDCLEKICKYLGNDNVRKDGYQWQQTALTFIHGCLFSVKIDQFINHEIQKSDELTSYVQYFDDIKLLHEKIQKHKSDTNYGTSFLNPLYSAEILCIEKFITHNEQLYSYNITFITEIIQNIINSYDKLNTNTITTYLQKINNIIKKINTPKTDLETGEQYVRIDDKYEQGITDCKTLLLECINTITSYQTMSQD